MRRFIPVLLVVPLLLLGCASSQANSPDVLKVKGLYIGMNIDEACKVICQLLNDSSYTVREAPVLGSTYAVMNSDSLSGLTTVWVTAGPDRIVNSIHISQYIVDKLFNSKGIESKDFVQEFISSYHIPTMEPKYDENGSFFWQFISTNGYKLTIDNNKNIVIVAVPKQGERKFN